MSVITKQTVASTDDCRVTDYIGFLSINLTNTWQVAGRDYDPYSEDYWNYFGGMRFLGITIPQGSTILSAYLKLKCAWSNAVNDVLTQIEGENANDTATFFGGQAGLDNYLNRPRTTAKVNWDYIPAWIKDVWYSSPDIKTIIQEIVNRLGWASGNSMVIFWNERASSGGVTACNRIGYSYDGLPLGSPTLEITYEIPVTVARQLQIDGLVMIQV